MATLWLQDPRWAAERARNPYLEGRRPDIYAPLTMPLVKVGAMLYAFVCVRVRVRVVWCVCVRVSE